MMTQMHNWQDYLKQKQIKLAFVITGIFLIFMGTTIWILNLANIVKGPWSSIVSMIFTVLGILIALLQWHFQPTSDIYAVFSAPTTQESDPQSYAATEASNPKLSDGKGALIVHARRSLHGMTVSLNRGFDTISLKTHLASNIVEREENGHTIFTSTFPLLEPGNYTVHTDSGQLTARVTIIPGHIAEIDWR